MVHGTPWRLRCGILLAFTFLCAHQPLQAQSLFGGIEALLGGSPEPAVQAPVTTGALQTNQQRTRFVIGLPKTTEFEVFSLSNPNRVVVQVTETKLALAGATQDRAGRADQVVPGGSCRNRPLPRHHLRHRAGHRLQRAHREVARRYCRASRRRDRFVRSRHRQHCPAGQTEDGHDAAAVRIGRRRLCSRRCRARLSRRMCLAQSRLQAGHRHRPRARRT